MVLNRRRGWMHERTAGVIRKALKDHQVGIAPFTVLEKMVYPALLCVVVFLLVVAVWNAGILVGDIEGGGGPLQYVMEPLLLECLD